MPPPAKENKAARLGLVPSAGHRRAGEPLRLVSPAVNRAVRIDASGVGLDGNLVLPGAARGVVLFAHGSGSSRHSPRNQFVAAALQNAGLATLLIDLLAPAEAAADAIDGRLRFDVGLLARRLVHAARWIAQQADLRPLQTGFFGASTGAAAALVAAAALGTDIKAVVCRGGRPDLAAEFLARVTSPTLLIVGARDEPVLRLNQAAYQLLPGEKQLRVVPGASHLFEEPGALDEVAALAATWFLRHLGPGRVHS